ncbi:MAG: hypothetical protein KDC54_14305, partial [Lewinella sp.]|nr:hypothetical protein [Lewinella sp.]
MRQLILILLLVGCATVLTGQTYYVAVIKGEVYYNDQLLHKRDKIELSGTLRFSSVDDYIKVSGAGGLHTIRPEGVQRNRRNELLVTVRQELFPEVRVRSTVAQDMLPKGWSRYFGLNGEGGNFLLPQHYHLDTNRQREAQAIGLLHATARGLLWRPLLLDKQGYLTIDSTTFQLPTGTNGHIRVDSSAVVLVRDTLAWRQLIGQASDFQSVRDSVDEYLFYYDRDVEPITMVMEQDSLTGEWREVVPTPPPPKPAEILDYLQPFRFVDPSVFLEDMRFQLQQTSARTAAEFLHDYYFDEYISEVYGDPQGYQRVVEALVPEPYPSQVDFMGDWYQKPLRVGIIGLVHTHVHWLLGRED